MARNARGVSVTHAVFLLLCCYFIAPLARAQYDVEQESRVWLRGMLDVRSVRGGSDRSWTDGGPGKTRYGGDTNSERETRYTLSQLAIEAGAALPWNVRAQLQLNLQRDLSDNDEPWLVEALLRKEWGKDDDGVGLQIGLMSTPCSLAATHDSQYDDVVRLNRIQGRREKRASNTAARLHQLLSTNWVMQGLRWIASSTASMKRGARSGSRLA